MDPVQPAQPSEPSFALASLQLWPTQQQQRQGVYSNSDITSTPTGEPPDPRSGLSCARNPTSGIRQPVPRRRRLRKKGTKGKVTIKLFRFEQVCAFFYVRLRKLALPCPTLPCTVPGWAPLCSTLLCSAGRAGLRSDVLCSALLCLALICCALSSAGPCFALLSYAMPRFAVRCCTLLCYGMLHCAVL